MKIEFPAINLLPLRQFMRAILSRCARPDDGLPFDFLIAVEHLLRIDVSLLRRRAADWLIK